MDVPAPVVTVTGTVAPFDGPVGAVAVHELCDGQWNGASTPPKSTAMFPEGA